MHGRRRHKGSKRLSSGRRAAECCCNVASAKRATAQIAVTLAARWSWQSYCDRSATNRHLNNARTAAEIFAPRTSYLHRAQLSHSSSMRSQCGGHSADGSRRSAHQKRSCGQGLTLISRDPNLALLLVALEAANRGQSKPPRICFNSQ